MNRLLLIAALVAVSSPALAKSDRAVRVCNESGACKRVPETQVRRALLSVTGQIPVTSEATSSAATNRRQLNALLARLR